MKMIKTTKHYTVETVLKSIKKIIEKDKYRKVCISLKNISVLLGKLSVLPEITLAFEK